MIKVVPGMITIACLALIGLAQGQEMGTRVSLSAENLAGGVLKPDEVHAERTLTLDTARQVTLVVPSAVELTVTLRRPDGAILSRANADRDRLQWYSFVGNGAQQGLIVPGAGSGFNTLITLTSPEVGRYTVRLDSRKASREAVPFLITLTEDSDLRMGLMTPFTDAVRGGPFVVSAVLFDQDRPVQGAKVIATFTRTDDDPAAQPALLRVLALTDNGEGADTTRGDGIYTGIVAAKSTGRHWIAVRASGTNHAGVPFERHSGTTFLVSEPSVRIAKVGAAEWLAGRSRRVSELRVPIELRGPAGEYEVVVSVRAKNGRQTGGNQLVAIDSKGSARVSVGIDAARIKLLGMDGPYHVQATEVYELANQDRVLRARRVSTDQTPPLKLKDLSVR